jgi:hypothetical protein
MNLFLHPSLSDLFYALVAALLLSGLGWLLRQAMRGQRKGLRRYTLLGTVGDDGGPLLYETTRAPGTVISRDIGGHREQFELTHVLLRDGTYAAEHLDRYV